MNKVLVAALFACSTLCAQQKQLTTIRDLNKTEYEVAQLQEKVDNINSSLKSAEEAIMNLEVQLQFQMQSMIIKKKLVQEKLKDLVIYSTPERLNFLITTEDFEAIGRSEAVILRMLKKDMQDYKVLEEESKKINSTRDFISKEKLKLEEDRKNYAIYLEELKLARDKKKQLLEKVKSTSQGYRALVKRLEKGGNQISYFAGGGNTIKKASAKKYAGLFNSISAPLKGKLISRFGRIWDPKIKNWTYNRGIMVSADYGKEVRSIADGHVSFSGWILGYGKVIIIKHKDSLFSVYAHLARGIFNTGDTVSKGSVIGSVGDSGSVEESSLYFELRQDRNDIDPTPLFY